MFDIELLRAFLEFLSPKDLFLNWLDLLIFSVIAFYIVEGAVVGVVVGIVDFISFVLSFLIGLVVYRYIGGILSYFFPISLGFANALGFFAASFIAEFFLAMFLRLVVYRLMVASSAPSEDKDFLAKLEKFLGIFPAVASAIVLVSFLLTVVVALPFSPVLKQEIFNSKIGNFLLTKTQGFEKQMRDVFGQAAQETLTFLTVNTKSSDGIALNFKVKEKTVDIAAENLMLTMVNQERKNNGLLLTVMSSKLQEVARLHADDMLARGYFSHYTPEGLSPFDRLVKYDIVYRAAGENLAFAPDTQIAMRGLMNSPGHRANILSESFGQVGIGVIDAGAYGKIFVQEFTD